MKVCESSDPRWLPRTRRGPSRLWGRPGRIVIAVAVAACVLGPASSTLAGVGDAVSGHRFAVLAAIQTAYLSTVVQCTNLGATGSASGPFTVEFFDGRGQLTMRSRRRGPS